MTAALSSYNSGPLSRAGVPYTPSDSAIAATTPAPLARAAADTIYFASASWCETREIVCGNTNKSKARKECVARLARLSKLSRLSSKSPPRFLIMASPTYYDDPLDDPLDDPTYDDVVLEEGDDEEGGDALAATIISWREEEDDKEVEEPEATTAAAVEVVDLDAEEEEEEEAAASSSVRLRLRGYQGAMRPGYHTSVLCTTPEGHYWAGYVLRWEEMRAAEPCVVRAAVKHSSGDQVWVEELVVEHDRVQKITDPCGALRLLASPSNVEWLHSISGGRDNRRHIVSQLVACCRHPALNASIDEAHRVDALEIELLSALGLSR